MDLIDYSQDKKIASFDLRDQISSENWYGDIETKPEIEKELFQEQENYYYATTYENKHKAWLNMFYKTKIYAKSLIQRRLKNRFYYMPDEIDEKASTCALNFMSQYIDRPGFHIGASFAGVINTKVMEVLYKKQIEEKHLSLSSYNEETSSIEEMQESLKIESIFSKNIDFTEIGNKNINSIIKEMLVSFNKVNLIDTKQKILIKIWLLFLLKKPKNKHIKEYFKKNYCDFKMLKLIDLFELELFNRINRS